MFRVFVVLAILVAYAGLALIVGRFFGLNDSQSQASPKGRKMSTQADRGTH